MKFITVLFFIYFFNPSLFARETSPEEYASMNEGLEQWSELVKTIDTLPRSKAFDELGTGLRKTTLKSIYRIPEREEVRKKIQTTLLSIPGHAEYYRDKIEQSQKEIDSTTIETDAHATARHSLSQNLAYGMTTLKELPSSETLKVLGEMLSDERARIKLLPDKSNWETVSHTPVTADKAAVTLRDMLENPPIPGDFDPERDLPIWRNWYQQIKEGRRTVRFKGDPIEYNLNGPATAAKNPDLPRVVRRPHEQQSAPLQAQAEVPRRTSNAPWIAAIVASLITFFAWRILRNKRPA